MQIKEPTTYEEQIDRIKEKGFLISAQEKSKCIQFLQQVNYYRVSAYFLPFRKKDGTYVQGIPLCKVQKIYEFDSRLRGLIFLIIEDIEISIRTKLAYFAAHKYGALGYLSENMFSNKHNAAKFEEKVRMCIAENETTLVVKHHKTNYGGQFPIWIIIEFFSVGMLSYFYKDMLTEDKKKIASEMGTVPKLLESWLRCLTDLRNKCAHYSRLYYWIFPAIPAIPKGVEIQADRKLFTQLMVLKYLYPEPEKWYSRFIIPLKVLIEEYEQDISLKHIGFPENWESLLKRN